MGRREGGGSSTLFSLYHSTYHYGKALLQFSIDWMWYMYVIYVFYHSMSQYKIIRVFILSLFECVYNVSKYCKHACYAVQT